MKRTTLIAGIAVFALGGLSAGFGLSQGGDVPNQSADSPAPVPAPEDDPCAQYIAQGIACEFVAFEEMEIAPSISQEVARR